MNVHAQKCNHGKNHDLGGKRQHHVDDSHDDFIDFAAHVACEHTEGQSQTDRSEHGQDRQEKSGTNAVEHA